MKPLSGAAWLCVAVVVAVALIVLWRAPWAWRPEYALPGLGYAAGAVLGARLKVRMPGMTGTLSVSFVFVLLAVLELDWPEVLAVALAGILAQVWWGARERPSAVQVVFNLASATAAAGSAHAVYHAPMLARTALPLLIFLAALAYYAVNSATVAAIVALTERRPLLPLLRESFLWVAPEFLVGAALAGGFHAASRRLGWQVALLALPAAYLIYRSYRLYVQRLEDEKRHATDLAELHWRTIEALALAIDAKDNTTHEHLTRVQIYATGVAQELALGDEEMKGLQIAALLHDIGKLAVPEVILNKPGKLTLEEFEIMKIHPVVGAEILERVGFPFPVVPIVRSHHERWDGSGYPAGLRGEEIPIGARVLAAVDCLDALASNRQYRHALPLREAMERVAAESGRAFDPRVVQILQRCYADLEERARGTLSGGARLTSVAGPRGAGRPAAGYEIPLEAPPEAESAALAADLASVRHELENVGEVAAELGGILTPAEILPLLLAPLSRAVAHDVVVVYLDHQGTLLPEYVAGEEFQLFSALRVPLGRGIAGWVARNRRPIINGDPTLEFGSQDESAARTRMGSALAVPLEGAAGVIGTVALYHGGADHFTAADARLLLGAAPRIGLALEAARQHCASRSEGEVDEITGLPGSRQLFLYLERELGRCRREQRGLAVLVFALDDLRAMRRQFGEVLRDRVLCEVARGLRENCRDYDFVARTGGDGFAVVLPGSPPEGGMRRALDLAAAAEESARAARAEQPLKLDSGEADFPDDGETAEQLLAEAERRLYRARQARVEADL